MAILAILAGAISIIIGGTPPSTNSWNGWNEIPRDSLDALYIGNSHTECTVAPLQLFGETGLRTWVLKASGCNTAVKYFYLKEALKTQKPKVVFVEVHDEQKSEKQDNEHNLTAYEYMPFGLNKLLALGATVPLKNLEDYLILQERSRFGWLAGRGGTGEQFLSQETTSSAGAYILDFPLDAESAKTYHPYSEAYPIPQEGDYQFKIRYLKKMAGLCKENNVDLVFWLSPSQYLYQYRYIAKIKKSLSAEYPEVCYLDMNEYQKEIGLVKSDFRDSSHVFLWGQKKTTSWLGQYLMRQYRMEPTDRKSSEWWERQSVNWLAATAGSSSAR